MNAYEMRARTLAAMQGQGGEVAWAPERLRPLAQAFVIGFGREPLRKERGFWIEALGDMVELGIEPEEVSDAMHQMREDGLTIKSPASVIAVADELHRRGAPKKDYLGGEYAEWIQSTVPTEPPTNPKLRAAWDKFHSGDD